MLPKRSVIQIHHDANHPGTKSEQCLFAFIRCRDETVISAAQMIALPTL